MAFELLKSIGHNDMMGLGAWLRLLLPKVLLAFFPDLPSLGGSAFCSNSY